MARFFDEKGAGSEGMFPMKRCYGWRSPAAPSLNPRNTVEIKSRDAEYGEPTEIME